MPVQAITYHCPGGVNEAGQGQEGHGQRDGANKPWEDEILHHIFARTRRGLQGAHD